MSASASDKGGYVRLISNEKHVFIIERRVAQVSGTLRTILSGPGSEAGKSEVTLDFPTAVLEKVVQYFVRGGGKLVQPVPRLRPTPALRT
jgi:hypothetical protein